jgi:glucan endo-1,3-alpha-glucosidase
MTLAVPSLSLEAQDGCHVVSQGRVLPLPGKSQPHSSTLLEPSPDHSQVGLTFNQKAEHWQYDIGNATTSAIDGFALNIGAGDNHTLEALHGAYDSAAKIGNFSLFLSFDFGATGNWTVDSVASLINDFRDEPVQFKVDGKPLVSTFEGVGFADKWKDVRRKVPGDIYFVPDWSSLGYEGIQNVTNEIDGHFSFDAWPQREETTITTRIDKLYQKVLGSTRSYMMGVSPYFYTSKRTNHPLFGRNNTTCPLRARLQC